MRPTVVLRGYKIKWFKHISDSLDDPFIFDLIDKFGGDGYLVFFGTLEVMSREFDVNSPGTCRVSVKFLAKKLQISVKKLKTILEFCAKNGRIHHTINGCVLTLNCNKLKSLCDEYTHRNLKKKSGVNRDNNTSDSVTIEEEVRNKKKKEKSVFLSDSIEYRLADLLYKLILNRNNGFKKPNLQSWAKQIDLMIRIDKRKPDDIKTAIKWCQSDISDKQPEGSWKGWANNILSTATLRKQFDKLVFKMEEEPKQPKIQKTLTKKQIEKLNE